MECIQLITYLPKGYVMDGSVDYSAELIEAIEAAVDEGCRRVEMPKFPIGIASTITLVDAVTIFGNGAEGEAHTGSLLRWLGANGETMMEINNVERGGGLRDISFDGNSRAANCLVIDGSCFGEYRNVRFFNFTTGAGLKTLATSHVMAFNTFINLIINGTETGDSCLWLSGSPSADDTNQNTFINSHITISGTRVGIRLGICDFNSFYDTFIFATDAANAGVYADSDEHPTNQRPNGNLFVRLAPGPGGWVQPSSSVHLVSPNIVLWYGKSNGEPDPVLNGANDKLIWTDENGRYHATDLSVFGSVVATNPSTSAANNFTIKASDYGTSFKSVSLDLGDSAVGGPILSEPHANSASLYAQNVERLLIGTNADVPIILASANSEKARISAQGLTLGGGAPVSKIISATISWPIKSSHNGDNELNDVALNGVTDGDAIIVSPDGYYGIITSEIVVADQVRLKYTNNTGEDQSPPERTFRITAIKFG